MAKSRSEAAPSAPDNDPTGVASTPKPEETVGRRALLRRAATVAAAGIGGVAAAEMLSAGPAAAAAGDPLTLGQSNSAGSAQTFVTSSTQAGATLDIANTSKVANVRLAPLTTASDYTTNGDSLGTLKGGELLNLTETVSGNPNDTLFWMSGNDTDGKLENLTVVLTTATGNVFAPVTPNRWLDTRSTTGRKHVLNNSVIDSSGRLIGGKVLQLDLSDLVIFAYAVHFNLTSTRQPGGGYLTVFPGPTQPLASNLNFTKAVSIANHGVCGLSSKLSISIYASSTTAVILDIQGWTLPDFSFLGNGTGIAAAQVAGSDAKAAPGRSPYALRSIPNRNGN